MRFVIGFIGTAIVAAFTVWLMGYDFDYRSVDVAFGFVFCFIFAFIGGVALETTKY